MARNVHAQDIDDWLRLSLLSGIGAASLRRLLDAFGSPDRILSASDAALSRVVGARAAQALRAEVPAASLRAVHDWVVRPGHHLLTLTDPAYPARLSNVPDPPLVLYVAGDPALLSRPSLAIVGSRSPSPRGLRDAQSFAQEFSEAGLCIVSGLALGIDAAAHRGGLDGGASSIAVVGTGLDCTYPGRNAELARELSERGAVVSEFPLGTPPLRSNFPRRNRIISGLSLGCLVVEAALHSGSLITAKEAAEQGRDVFAVPGSIHSALAKGCHWLIKQGAKLAESADDVLGELGVGNGSSVTHGPATLDVPDADSVRLLQALGGDTLTVDALCERAGLTAEVASAMLLTLELDGYVARLAGGFYQSLR